MKKLTDEELAQAPPPNRTGRPPTNIVLTGKLLPWEQGKPALMKLVGSPHIYLPCFSTEEKLREMMGRAEIPFEKIKQIDDGDEFSDSVPRYIKIIVDPYFLGEDGRVRYLEVQRWDEN